MEDKPLQPQEADTQGFLQFSDLDDRRKQVFHLRTRGHTNQEIADMFGVHKDTIKTDLRIYRARLKEAQTKLDRDEYVAETRADFEQMRQELWKTYQKASKPGEKARLIDLIAKLRDRETKLLHDCDLLEKAPQRIEHTHHVSGQVTHLKVDLSESMLEAVETMIMAQHMNLSPEQLLKLRGREPEYIDVPAREPKQEPALKPHTKRLPAPGSTVEQGDDNE